MIYLHLFLKCVHLYTVFSSVICTASNVFFYDNNSEYIIVNCHQALSYNSLFVPRYIVCGLFLINPRILSILKIIHTANLVDDMLT